MHSLQSSACQAPESWFMVREARRRLCKLNFIAFSFCFFFFFQEEQLIWGTEHFYLVLGLFFILFCSVLFSFIYHFQYFYNILRVLIERRELYYIAKIWLEAHLRSYDRLMRAKEKNSYRQSLTIFVIQHCLDASFTYGTVDWNFKPS